jgi:hypothetical protein
LAHFGTLRSEPLSSAASYKGIWWKKNSKERTMKKLHNARREFRKNAKRTVLFFVLICVSTLSTTAVFSQNTPVKHSQVRIYITGAQDISSLSAAGLVFDHIDLHDTYFDVALNNHELDLLRRTAWPFQIVVDDMEAEYRRRPGLSPAEMRSLEARMKRQYNLDGFGFGSMGGYYTFDEVVAKLDEMRASYPNLISAKQSIGSSIENRTIWMVSGASEAIIPPKSPNT